MSEPWNHLQSLQYELSQFSSRLSERSQLVIANKIDLPDTDENVKILKESTDLPVLAVSAKTGLNVTNLLKHIRIIYDNNEAKKGNSVENKD